MRILLADDQSKVRFALRILLERQPGLEVVGEAVNGWDLVDRIRSLHPDAILLDWELSGLSATRAIPSLRKAFPGLIIIALSGRSEARGAADAAGADAFVSKTDPPEILLAALISASEPSQTGPSMLRSRQT
jgi:DNA-binding NarL/FixJ family response regulator